MVYNEYIIDAIVLDYTETTLVLKIKTYVNLNIHNTTYTLIYSVEIHMQYVSSLSLHVPYL